MKSSLENALFIISLLVISKYSSLLEPLTQALKSTQLNLLKMQYHIKDLADVIWNHRVTCVSTFGEIFQKAQDYAEAFGTNLSPLRTTHREVHCSNVTHGTSEEYFRRAVYIPCLDSLLESLQTGFSERNKPAYSLLELMPNDIVKLRQRRHFGDCTAK